MQRADSSLRLNVHFHTLALDGVYVRDEHGELRFVDLGEPSAADVHGLAAWTHAGLVRVLERHGRSLDGLDDGGDALPGDSPVLASCYGASTGDLQLLGALPGNRTDKLVRPLRLVPSPSELLAEVGGVNIHASAVVDGRDRKRLERICRYVARPPLSQERLELHGDGRVRYRFKAAWKDGTHAVLLDPQDFIARLCALVPPPRFHMLRYHGVLAAHSKVRARVVPGRATHAPAEQLVLFTSSDLGPLEPPPPPPSRHPWAWLLRRVFAVDVQRCPRCDAEMRIVTIATDPDDIAKALEGRPRSRAPPRAPPALPGQLHLKFESAGAP